MHRRRRERITFLYAGRTEAQMDVFRGVLLIECGQVEYMADSVFEGLQRGFHQPGLKSRFGGKDDGQEVLVTTIHDE